MTRIQHRSDPPAIGDPVVVDGTKHRIRELAPRMAHIAVAGPNWRHGVTLPLATDRLYWDPLAGVWRVG